MRSNSTNPLLQLAESASDLQASLALMAEWADYTDEDIPSERSKFEHLECLLQVHAVSTAALFHRVTVQLRTCTRLLYVFELLCLAIAVYSASVAASSTSLAARISCSVIGASSLATLVGTYRKWYPILITKGRAHEQSEADFMYAAQVLLPPAVVAQWKRTMRRRTWFLESLSWFCSGAAREDVEQVIDDIQRDCRAMTAEGRSGWFIRSAVIWQTFACVWAILWRGVVALSQVWKIYLPLK
jgi:hypothetical protein